MMELIVQGSCKGGTDLGEVRDEDNLLLGCVLDVLEQIDEGDQLA